MQKPKKESDFFDDDFEVTLTDTLPHVSIDFEEEWDETEELDDDYEEDYVDEYDYEDRHSYPPVRSNRPSNSPRSRKMSGEELASPLRAPMRHSTRLIGSITFVLLRLGPLILSGTVIFLTAFVFWTEHSAYGEPVSITTDGNLTLAAYFVIGGILILWGLFTFLFILGDSRARKGRGLTFFILFYALSYVSELTARLIPDGLTLIDGIKGGLLTYGSLYPRLFTLSLLGIAACIFRRIFK